MPLNEETESYRIQVKAEGKLKRELMAGTSVWDYTVEMRADDGVVGACAVEVAQMSAQFGAGLAARTVVATSCGPFWLLILRRRRAHYWPRHPSSACNCLRNC